MRVLNFILFIAIINLQFCCNSIRKSQKEQAIPEINYISLSLSELIKNKEEYHNKAVIVKAYYTCGYNSNALLSELILPAGYDTTKKYYDITSGIGVIENYSKTNIPCDSLNEKIITVKGICDTSSHGHSGYYAASIKNAILVK